MHGIPIRTWISFLPLLAIGACTRGDPPDLPPSADVPVVDVMIDTVQRGSIPEEVHAIGNTRALRNAAIGSPVDGKVITLNILEGDRVHRGQILAIVETRESIAAITGAQLLLAQARTEEERQEAAVDVARAELHQTRIELRAPFDGLVTSRSLNAGDLVNSGTTLMGLVDMTSLCFVARIPARDLPHLQLNQEAIIHFENLPGPAYRARVDNIKPQIDSMTQLADVRLRIVDSTANLGIDQFGRVAIVTSLHQDVLLVPTAAVLRDDETGLHTIVEAVGDSIGISRLVHVGIQTPTLVEVGGPYVHPEMHIVVEGHYGLPDSTRIHALGRGGS